MRQRTKVSQLPLDQCGRGTSVGGESAAGGRLEAGGRELVMRATDDGVSCLYVSAEKGHLEVVKALLEAGGRELVMLTADGGLSCLYISAQEGHQEVVRARSLSVFLSSYSGPVRPEAVLPDRALCLPTFSHFLMSIVKKNFLSLPPSQRERPLSPAVTPEAMAALSSLTSIL
jgi:hypothetical protein